MSKLLDRLNSDNEIGKAQIRRYLKEIVDACNEILPKELKDYNEYEFNYIKNKSELILKKVAKMARNYDVINLLNSGEIDEVK